MAVPLDDKGRGFQFILLANETGIVFRWNIRDMCNPDVQVYGIEFRWRSWEPRLWWTFEWTNWHGTGKLRYSHGRKYRQRSGWTIQGPLVKFVVEKL